MINKQLTSFIKEQLEKGVDKDIISRDLLVNNWTKQDIEEGFKSLDILDKNTSSVPSFNMQSNHLDTSVTESGNVAFKVALTVLGLFLLAGGAFGYLFRNDIPLIKNLTKSKDVPVNEIQNLEKESQVKQEDTKKEEPIISEPNKGVGIVIENNEKKDTTPNDVELVGKINPEKVALINCVNDVDCFISASKECTPATIEEIKILDIFGMVQTTKIKNTINGLDTFKKCLFTTHIIDASLSYSPEIIAQAKASGTTDQELKLQLDKSNESLKMTIGMITKCSFTPDYLSQMLIKWKDGSFSSSDMDSGNCTTTLTQ